MFITSGTYSTPNKGHDIDQDTSIATSGNNVYVTWWTNRTGSDMPVLPHSFPWSIIILHIWIAMQLLPSYNAVETKKILSIIIFYYRKLLW